MTASGVGTVHETYQNQLTAILNTTFLSSQLKRSVSSPSEWLFRSFGNLPFAWLDVRVLRFPSSSLSHPVYLHFPTWR